MFVSNRQMCDLSEVVSARKQMGLQTFDLSEVFFSQESGMTEFYMILNCYAA